MENTSTPHNIQDSLNESDNNGLNYKIEQIGKSIFKMAENDNEILFLLGNNIIKKIEKTDELWWFDDLNTRLALKKMNTKLLIPVIAALIETVIKEQNKKIGK